MALTDEEEKKLKDQMAATEKALADEKAARVKDVAAKDAIIEQKNADIVGARNETTRLKKLSEDEKAKMSEKEIELHNATLKLQEDTEKFQADQKAAQQKEVDARKERAIAKIAGKDPELAQKVRDAYGKIIDHDKASTEEEISAIATSAFNMLGVPKPNPVNDAMNGGADGDASTDDGGKGFADSKEGKSLAEAMGLQTELPPEQK